MEKQRFEGQTVEEAVQKGLDTLGLDEDQVEVTITQEGKKGFLGLGSRPAVVELTVKAVSEPAGSPHQDEEKAAESEEEADSAGQESQEAAEPLETSETRDQGDDQEEKTSDQEEAPVRRQYEVEDVAQYLIDVMKAYLVDITVEVEEDEDQIVFHIETDKPGLVIGKHGKIVNALETLAQTLVHRYVRSRVGVVVNVGDYRERREETLKKIAERTADEVTVNKGTVELDPLPSGERKIIHQTLSKYNHIETHSEGKEPYRYLVVSYKES